MRSDIYRSIKNANTTPDKQFSDRNVLVFFLFLHKNICCGYSLEVPRGGTSNEYPQHMCLFVLRFYGSVNPMGSCRAQSVYLTTRLLGRLSPLSG